MQASKLTLTLASTDRVLSSAAVISVGEGAIEIGWYHRCSAVGRCTVGEGTHSYWVKTHTLSIWLDVQLKNHGKHSTGAWFSSACNAIHLIAVHSCDDQSIPLAARSTQCQMRSLAVSGNIHTFRFNCLRKWAPGRDVDQNIKLAYFADMKCHSRTVATERYHRDRKWAKP